MKAVRLTGLVLAIFVIYKTKLHNVNLTLLLIPNNNLRKLVSYSIYIG
jgi:hypothetical protein